MNIKEILSNISPRKVFVGLSGGVDSSVAAALLQEQGHHVRGVYLKVWSPELEDFLG
ncbi:MAG: tRNA 2-thiouridine(34) synthase MnmA, partial [Patescibacteria group bacterium]|nr:tRNA 2-thiouridine(34) synthase MnmA [Patescibacteria group bacterium]